MSAEREVALSAFHQGWLWLKAALGWGFVALFIAATLWGGQRLYRFVDVPVGVIGVDGRLTRVSASEIETIVADNLEGGFLSLDLEPIRLALEAHPWVASVEARRKWPGQLVISIDEEVAIARWGRRGFLNNKGKLLDVGDVDLPQSLPLLDGPEGMERRVMQQYRAFSQLLQPAGLKIDSCELAERGNWTVKLSSGPSLQIGKEPVATKLQRFLLVWEQALASQAERVDSVDLRYGNGVAVRWKKQTDTSLDLGGQELKRSVNG